MTSPESPGVDAPDVPTCYRHPSRETYVRCTRCERPICPDCMTSAAVGFHCPSCTAEGRASQRMPRTVFGGSLVRSGPVVTYAIIAICVVVYLLQQVVPGLQERAWLIGYAYGTQGVEGVADGEYWRLITAAFLHGGLLHLLFNMYALYLFGPALERALGHARYLVLYLLSAIGGSALSFAWSSPNQPSLGASGAVFGVLGAALVVARQLGYDTRALLVLIGINLAFGFLVPDIDWHAHIGGLVAGALLALVFAASGRVARRGRVLVVAGGSVALLAVEVAVVLLRMADLGALG